MSNALSIAAVTATLQSIMHDGVTKIDGLQDTTVTILPLDKARSTTNNANQLNLFLYQMARDAAWSNADIPQRVKPGETGIPPLALTLYFLVTAFGQDDDSAKPYGHTLLGTAMSLLHDHPVLSADEIRSATKDSLKGNDLDQQVERVRVTLHLPTIDELSKLWTGFGMQYRLSAAYEVGVTLIESTRAAKTPLPVVARGPNDRGSASQADTSPPLPTLFSIETPNAQPSARLGDVLTLTGVHLDGTAVKIRFGHKLLAAPLDLGPDTATPTVLHATIPVDVSQWPAGVYSVEVLVQRSGENFFRSTNQVPLTLAPSFSLAQDSANPNRFMATVAPEVRIEQRVTLLLNDREFQLAAPDPLAPTPPQTGTLVFDTGGIAPGAYWSRLRVDGVDSLLVDRTHAPPRFDPGQAVNVT